MSLSGFSPETTIIAFRMVQPEQLMIIGSDATLSSVDTSLRAFWQLEFDGEDVDDRIAQLTFLVDI
jgi:hypothetical protein